MPENAQTPTTCPGVVCRGSGARIVRQPHRTPDFKLKNQSHRPLETIIARTFDFDNSKNITDQNVKNQNTNEFISIFATRRDAAR